MRSHLTPLVFRQILRNAPLTHANCSRLPINYLVRSDYRIRPAPRISTRSIWGFGRQTQEEPKPVNVDPGYEPLRRLNNALKTDTRPPSESDIRESIDRLLAFKVQGRMALNDLEIIHVLAGFNHLQALSDLDEKAAGVSGFRSETLSAVLACLTRSEYKFGSPKDKILELGEIAFKELERRRQEDGQLSDLGNSEVINCLHRYISILSYCGNGVEARDFLESISEEERSRRLHLWHILLAKFVRNRNWTELSKTLELMEKLGMQLGPSTQEFLVIESALSNNLVAAKSWYNHPLFKGKSPTSRAKTQILDLCIAHKDMEWGQHILNESLTAEQLHKTFWDLTFKWAAALGKSVDEIGRMMDVMARRGETPDIHTINNLVEYANSSNDPYTAERFIALAERRGIAPDAQTFILQMEYRLLVGDLGGAETAYSQLQAYEVPEGQDIVLLNKLIVALCKVKDPDHDNIMEHVGDLTARKGRFEAATVVALCQLHLQRNELQDVVDLLQTHASHLDIEERVSVQNSFLEFILIRKNSTSSAWDAYTVLQEFFADIDLDIRTRIMDAFFQRRRCDMGVHVFGHIRRSNFSDTRATPDIYIRCLEGIARLGDEQALVTVHNMLKLDSDIELNTQLNNALMLAYIGCDDPRQSLEFWNDIMYSREGPTYNSICIALRACEFAPFGEETAKEIWNKLKRFGIDPTKEIYASYIGALAGHRLIEDAIKVVGEVEGELGSPPDALIIGTLCNAPRNQDSHDEAQKWAKSAFPMIWEALEAAGRDRTGRFKLLDRKLSA